MRRALAALLLAGLGAGCTMTAPHRPVYHPEAVRASGELTLVVAAEADPANLPGAERLARGLAFGLAQRGWSAVDLPAFAQALETAGRPLPEPLRLRLRAGVVDPPAAAWLRGERVRYLVFLEVRVLEQVWTSNGKRSRAGLSARGRDLANGEQTWHAYATPEVEDEPGRGLTLAGEAALGALVRVISGEPEPLRIPKVTLPDLPTIRVPF
jgi:hypothetical protein